MERRIVISSVAGVVAFGSLAACAPEEPERFRIQTPVNCAYERIDLGVAEVSSYGFSAADMVGVIGAERSWEVHWFDDWGRGPESEVLTVTFGPPFEVREEDSRWCGQVGLKFSSMVTLASADGSLAGEGTATFWAESLSEIGFKVRTQELTPSPARQAEAVSRLESYDPPPTCTGGFVAGAWRFSMYGHIDQEIVYGIPDRGSAGISVKTKWLDCPVQPQSSPSLWWAERAEPL